MYIKVYNQRLKRKRTFAQSSLFPPSTGGFFLARQHVSVRITLSEPRSVHIVFPHYKSIHSYVS